MLPDPNASQPSADVEHWIAEARGGSAEALNRLLALFRPYLLLAANEDFDPAMQARVAPSDVVQNTLLEAARGFPDFRGGTEAELLAWLRRILHNNLVNERRYHLTAGVRSVDREVSLADALPPEVQERVPNRAESPSAQLRARERDEVLERALGRLPERYRDVLLLRTRDRLTFAQVGERLGCSEEAARKLWGRAVEELARLLRDEP